MKIVANSTWSLFVIVVFLGNLIGPLEAKSIFVLEDLLGGSEDDGRKPQVAAIEAGQQQSIASHFKVDSSSLHLKEEKKESPSKHHHLHHDEDAKKHEKEPSKMDHLLNSCHSYVADKVETQEECAFHSSGSNPSIAVCRWDPRYGKGGACLCPRSKADCYSHDRKCYWYESKMSAHGDKGKKKGICISNAEKFYYVLHNLLLRRGKKDFAIRILYNSSPAVGSLPYGPHGPSIVYPRSPYSLNHHQLGRYQHSGDPLHPSYSSHMSYQSPFPTQPRQQYYSGPLRDKRSGAVYAASAAPASSSSSFYPN